jgi:hypothetical protein
MTRRSKRLLAVVFILLLLALLWLALRERKRAPSGPAPQKNLQSMVTPNAAIIAQETKKPIRKKRPSRKKARANILAPELHGPPEGNGPQFAHPAKPVEPPPKPVVLTAEELPTKPVEVLHGLIVGLRGGLVAPNFGFAIDASVLPIRILAGGVLSTRFSLGFVQDPAESNAPVWYASEIAQFASPWPDVKLYAGAGANLPFVAQASPGYNVVLGAAQKTAVLFRDNSEALFLETGQNSYVANGLNSATITLMIGYRGRF